MSAPAGWYPDPAGAPGRYRFWDGRAWGSETTDRPDVAHPAQQPELLSLGPPPAWTSEQKARVASGPPRRMRQGGRWIAAGAVLLALLVAAVLVVRSVGGTLLDGPDVPGPQPSQLGCPPADQSSQTRAPLREDGRVHSGRLSYPTLPPPFGAPMPDSRTPFGHDVQTQQALVERSADGETTWVAWALIAQLLAGDGFYRPEQGAEVVAGCVVDLFYNDHEIGRTDTRRQAIRVDGHEAYLIESHLTFDIPGIQTKGETMIVVVVDVGRPGEAGLFYGTIPDTSPQFMQPVRDALAGLKVG